MPCKHAVMQETLAGHMGNSGFSATPRGIREGNGTAANCSCTNTFHRRHSGERVWPWVHHPPLLLPKSTALRPVPFSCSVIKHAFTTPVFTVLGKHFDILLPCHLSTETAILGVPLFAVARKVCLKALQRNWNQTNFRWFHK